MGNPYRRRKPSLIRNFWVYRRLIGAAVLLGLLLWFIVINNQEVTVYFPLRLGQITSTAGLIILLGALVGSLATALLGTIVLAVRRYRTGGPGDDRRDFDGRGDLPDDRPPSDYAARTPEGFSDAPWSKG